jgi:hypothetical protein
MLSRVHVHRAMGVITIALPNPSKQRVRTQGHGKNTTGLLNPSLAVCTYTGPLGQYYCAA